MPRPCSGRFEQVFEYGADLKYYYVDGYGNEVNLELGCPLVQDLVDKLR